MGPHATRLPVIVAALIAVIAVVAAAPSGARAAGGDGPYTPFPDLPGNQAEDYVNRLNERSAGSGGARKISPQRLAEGVTSPPGEGGVPQAGGSANFSADGGGGSASRPRGGDGGSANRPGGGRGASADGSGDGVASAASPFGRAGISPASPPPDPSVVPFLALGGLMALAAAGVGVYRVRRRWAA